MGCGERLGSAGLLDVASMLVIGEQSLDLAYVERWVADLGLGAAWRRARALRSSG